MIHRHRFVVPGDPQPWRRARTNGPQRFTDPRSKSHADAVRWAWRAAGGPTVGTGPCLLEVTARFRRPPSHLLADGVALSAAGQRVLPGRGDSDNFTKAIMDYLNGFAWADDRQVVSQSGTRVWTRGLPETVVSFSPVVLIGDDVWMPA